MKKNPLIFLGTILLLLLSCETDQIPARLPTIHPTDSLVMIDFYHNMKAGEWEDNFDKKWIKDEPSTWSGITWVYDRTDKLLHVRGISINHIRNELKDITLPESIGNLTHLEELIITNSPGLTGKIPESLYNCPLAYLEIINTGLNGPLSPSIKKRFLTLKKLIISSNKNFVSELPSELGVLSYTELVDLSDNAFYGKVPAELINIGTSLNSSKTYLHNNQLSDIDWNLFRYTGGNIPYMQLNPFLGEIPEDILENSYWENKVNKYFLPFKDGYGFNNINQ